MLYTSKHRFWIFFPLIKVIFSSNLPAEQLLPIQPALQEQRPSVFRQALQFGEQGMEQFSPKYPGWQTVKIKFIIIVDERKLLANTRQFYL